MRISLLLSFLLREKKQLLAYLFFGICTVVINIVCYWLLHSLCRFDNILCVVLSWFAAVVFAFSTNRAFVFKNKGLSSRDCLKEFSSFFSFRVITGILDVVIMYVAVDFLRRNSLVWKLISSTIVIIINYLVSRFFVFNGTRKNCCS